jgi:hemolysin activation/secretion protein
MCVAIKIYQVNGSISVAANWQLLTAQQLAALQPGNIIYVTTLGTVSNGTIDKARIRVNSNTWSAANETTLKKPGSDEYYISYSIPSGATTFSFGAEIHEVTTNKWY